jgi:hypothetical protein
VAVGHSNSPYVSVYAWLASGFGTKFSNPATLPTGAGSGVAFSPSGDAISVVHSTSPSISTYPWSGSGFGTKYSDPSTLPSGGADVKFSPSGDAIAVSQSVSPYVVAYPWSGSGFGTKYSDPAILPIDSAYSVAFSPSGNAIAVANEDFANQYNNISTYAWSGAGFGSRYSDPAFSFFALYATGVAFSPAGDALAVSGSNTTLTTSRYLGVFLWSVSGGFVYGSVKYPSILPSGICEGVAFSPDGNAIAVAHRNSPYVTAYQWTGSDFGSKFVSPTTIPNTALSVTFGPAI